MSLINLKHIAKLESAVQYGSLITTEESLNWRRPRLDPQVFIHMIKAYNQVRNLNYRLSAVFEACTDFVNHKVEDRAADYYGDVPNDGSYLPFEDLTFHFFGSDLYRLPPRIEQYAELCAWVKDFPNLQVARRQGVERAYGSNVANTYLVKGEDGIITRVPESALSEPILNELEAERSILEIEIVYCLDRYNEFFKKCSQILTVGEMIGNIHQSAGEILCLFKPYNPDESDAKQIIE